MPGPSRAEAAGKTEQRTGREGRQPLPPFVPARHFRHSQTGWSAGSGAGSKFQARSAVAAVCTKRPFAGPEQVLAYLGRYTHRVAIANSRLIGLHDNKVNFTWKDYRHHGKTKVMTLAADEFIRRFLLHAVPDGFHRIRHVGFLANRRRTAKLALCRALLAAPKPEPPSSETYRQPAESLGPSLRIPIVEGHVRHAAWHRSVTQSIG